MHVHHQRYKCWYSRPICSESSIKSHPFFSVYLRGENTERKKIKNMLSAKQNSNLRTFPLSFGPLSTPLISFISWADPPNQSYLGQSSTGSSQVCFSWRVNYTLGLLKQMLYKVDIYQSTHITLGMFYCYSIFLLLFYLWYTLAIAVGFVTDMVQKGKSHWPTACPSVWLSALSRSPALLWVKPANVT